MENYDVLVVGGGIIGIASALTLKRRHCDLQIGVVESEKRVAVHQTGHNSGVLHSGIYYKPGSDKARHCRDGKGMMEDFCHEHAIPWDRCGKVVVATDETELSRLEGIGERAEQNGIPHERIATRESES